MFCGLLTRAWGCHNPRVSTLATALVAERDPLDGLVDPRVGVATDFAPSSDTLLIVFAGLGPTHGMPRFEFLRTAASLPVQRLYVCDHERAWYHRGVRGLGTSIRSTADALHALIAESGARRVVTTGNSAGGYAALLFGHLLGVDAVVAFAPRTSVGWGRRVLHRDTRRWREQVTLSRRGGPEREFGDLRRVLAGGTRFGDAVVHYAAGCRLDAVHARRLSGVPNVVMYPHAHRGHGLAQALRADGRLARLLAAAVA
jgi:hypothetical protein